MSPAEAQDSLRSQPERPNSGNNDNSRMLINALEYIPLVITHEAVFISENSLTLVEYLDLLYTNYSNLEDLLGKDLVILRRDLGC